MKKRKQNIHQQVQTVTEINLSVLCIDYEIVFLDCFTVDIYDYFFVARIELITLD